MCLRILSLLVISAYSREIDRHDIRNSVPAHLELLPEYRHHFEYLEPDVDTRIVGGIESIPHSRPYQVGISVPTTSGSSYFCGASIINEMNLLTAAHCVDVLDTNWGLIAYLGTHNIPPTVEDNAVAVIAYDVVVHPEWEPSTIRNDIAIIRLQEPVQFSATINRILLPQDDSQDYLGNTSLVTGWGRPEEFTPGISSVLNELSSHIMSNYACRLAYLGYVEDTNICMSSYVGRATCSGDSGGPLAVNGVQVGIVSFGSGWGCAQGYPSVFTRVTSYLNWINENLAPIPTTTTTTTTEATTTTTTEATTTTTTTSGSTIISPSIETVTIPQITTPIGEITTVNHTTISPSVETITVPWSTTPIDEDEEEDEDEDTTITDSTVSPVAETITVPRTTVSASADTITIPSSTAASDSLLRIKREAITLNKN